MQHANIQTSKKLCSNQISYSLLASWTLSDFLRFLRPLLKIQSYLKSKLRKYHQKFTPQSKSKPHVQPNTKNSSDQMPLSVLQMSASQLVTLGPFVTHTFMLPRYSSPHSVTISNRSNVLCPRSQQNEYHPLYPAPWPFCIKLISHYIHSSLLT